MKKLALLVVIASLGCVLPACGGGNKHPGDKPDSGQPHDDAGSDAQTDDQDGSAPAGDAGMDASEGDAGDDFHSGIDPNTLLHDLTEAQGKTVCNGAQDFANAKLTENQRAAANCIFNFGQGESAPQNLDDCQSALAECLQNMAGTQFLSELDLGCDELDVSTECPGDATVGDLEGCTNGFAGFWSLLEPITTCQGYLAANADDAGVPVDFAEVIAELQAGLDHCSTVTTACPDAVTVPSF